MHNFFNKSANVLLCFGCMILVNVSLFVCRESLAGNDACIDFRRFLIFSFLFLFFLPFFRRLEFIELGSLLSKMSSFLSFF